MQRKKRGLWLFICSLIPGAGEMYMGFMKHGISIMLLFWSIIAIAGYFNLGFIAFFVPIVWFYSFFNVHNLKVLSDEEFYSIEDNYILHFDRLLGGGSEFLPRYRRLLAVLMIVFGVGILWNMFTEFLYGLLPDGYFTRLIGNLLYSIPQIIIALLIILAGFYILAGKKKRLGNMNSSNASQTQEHYWEPYRPYQQPFSSQPSEQSGNFTDETEIQSKEDPVSEPKSNTENRNQPSHPSSSDPNL